MATAEDFVGRVREICLGLPKVVEKSGVASGVGRLSGTRVFGFTVSRRVVARLFVLDQEDAEVVVLWIRAAPAELEALVQSGHPYLRAGPREVAITLADDTDWTEIAELISESYVLMAPARRDTASPRKRL